METVFKKLKEKRKTNKRFFCPIFQFSTKMYILTQEKQQTRLDRRAADEAT
jgi:hypothetical protein